jgi:hypothetical protein
MTESSQLDVPSGAPPAAEPPAAGRPLFVDDFASGFDTAGRWEVHPRGGLPFGDGIARCEEGALTVIPTGTDAASGEPAFVVTYGQDAPEGGRSDHIKWAALTRRKARTGIRGFDIPASGRITFTVTISGHSFGCDRHPFGSAVVDPDSDVRLPAVDMIATDMESHMVFDFAITNSQVYAICERLPTPGHRYASFSYAIPVARRVSGQWHDCQIRVDEAGTRVTWLIDGRTVLSTDRIGYRVFDRDHMLLDHGGAEEAVQLRQLTLGLGLFTVLDAAGPDGRGLVRLDATPDFYYAPRRDGTVPQVFVDERSLPGRRVWGAGAIMRVRHAEVIVED